MGELKKSDKIFVGIVLAVIFGVGIWNIFLGVRGLFLSKRHSMDEVFEHAALEDTYEGEIVNVLNDKVVYHRQINNRWGGKEYYYIIYSREMDKAVIVRAPKNWLDKVVHQVPLVEKGIVKTLRYKVKKRLENMVSSLLEGVKIDQTVYLDLLATRICIVQLFAGISILVLTGYLCLLVRKLGRATEKPISKPLCIVMVVWFFITIVAFLYLRNKT